MDTDIVKTRRERLREIIDKRFGGKQANMVDETGINAGELSALLRKKHFGEKKARALEQQLGLPAMWLDGESRPKPAHENSELVEMWGYLLPAQRDEILARIRPLADHNRAVMQELAPYKTVSVSDSRKRQVSFGGPDRRKKEDES